MDSGPLDAMRLNQLMKNNCDFKVIALPRNITPTDGVPSNYLVLEQDCRTQTSFLKSLKQALNHCSQIHEVSITMDYFNFQSRFYK
jgi:hypothetical protein